MFFVSFCSTASSDLLKTYFLSNLSSLRGQPCRQPQKSQLVLHWRQGTEHRVSIVCTVLASL